ncbi:MAG: L,D-transpeptidase [Hyphomicrobiales bacterium]
MSLTRRQFAVGTAAATASVSMAWGAPAIAASNASAYFNGTITDHGFTFPRTNFASIKPRWKRQFVQFYSQEPSGTVVVDTRNHFLYVIFANKTALRYGVGVGREGFKWYGRAQILRKARWPRWVPPPEMRLRQPELPLAMEGGPKNPLGPRALYLYDGKRDLGYRLHGTTEPWSIGSDVSSGCIRMFPEDVIDLYQRCPIGTRVLVLEHIASNAG